MAKNRINFKMFFNRVVLSGSAILGSLGLTACINPSVSNEVYEKNGAVVSFLAHNYNGLHLKGRFGVCNYRQDFNNDRSFQPDECVGAKRKFSLDEKITVFADILSSTALDYSLRQRNGMIFDEVHFTGAAPSNMVRTYNSSENDKCLPTGAYSAIFESGGKPVVAIDFEIIEK